MAMNSDALGQKIANLIIDANCPNDIKVNITNQWKAIAKEIIDEIKNATITVESGISVTIPMTSPEGTASEGSTTSTGSATIS